MEITKKDIPHLLSDIRDYLFEREANIGTCFKEEFPNSCINGQQILLIGKDFKKVATITLSLPWINGKK